MADVHIHAERYNGHDLTVQLRLNTDTENFGNGTENTHTIYSAVDTLSTLSITAGSTGETITDAGLAGKYVSAVSIDGGNKIYASYDPDTDTTTFTKPIAGTTLTFLDGTTVTASDPVDIFYLADGSGNEETGIRSKYTPSVAERMSQILDELKVQVDSPTDPEIASIMRGLGYVRNT